MMSLIVSSSLLLTSSVGLQPVAARPVVQSTQLETKYDAASDRTTVTLPPLQISGERDEYYSLQMGASFDYSGRTVRTPEFARFEIRSVVKGRKLNPDLYVVLIIDGETIHLSSNRWAVKNPVPGRRMIGEQIVMRMPYQTLLKLAKAKQAAIRMGGTSFDLSDTHRKGLRALAEKAKP